ncbi:chorismate mutase 2, cytosolic-like [Phoenix dactylifera]|uniref:Chorismate mutase n=1 Tax=Phoenix dactylifera TaxID=42345 RepID=A0A8B7BGP0_PHODC|nr:chorismate mutase 2, cytosolic-like [Phoenix dactylifera]
MASTKVSNRASGETETGDPSKGMITLASVRDALIRQEDTIVFSLIERARFPHNAPVYDPSFLGSGQSLVEFFVRESESLHAKAGRYQNPEEVPFFPDDLPLPLVPPCDYPEVLHPTSASVSVCEAIWNMYLNDLLPLITVKGDDGNYASTAAADLACLQALSRRIHYGKFVAEVKFRDAPQDYTPAIRTKDGDALMKLLTFERVEQMVKKRVEKKAMVFGQDVTLQDKGNKVEFTDGEIKCKVDPSVVCRLYDEWVMPMTKLVEVEYLLRRLD